MCGHRSDLKEILSLSSIVFSLSTEPEAFGRTTLESLSIGTPVIGYAHGGVEEQLLQIFPDGLVPVGSTNCVVEKVNRWLASLPPLPAQHQFTVENMCKATLDVYQNTIDQSINGVR